MIDIRVKVAQIAAIDCLDVAFTVKDSLIAYVYFG